MWFKKQREEEKKFDERTGYLASFKPIGARASYLGVDCVVVRHHEYRPLDGWRPSLCLQYVNASGVIVDHVLPFELVAPLRESGVLR